MKKARMKVLSKAMVFIMVLSLIMMPLSSKAVVRLTNAKDTLSRTQASGTGVATRGYTESTQKVTDNFIFNSTNDAICMDKNGATNGWAVAVSCLPASGGAIANLTASDEGGLVANSLYTGDQIAAAIAKALAVVDGDADDGYTVTYDESTDKFTIRADGANTLNPTLVWTNSPATHAAVTLGYATTANDTEIRDNNAVSDNAVAFNVITGQNDTFRISVDQYSALTVTASAGVYTADGLRGEMDTKIDALAGTPDMPPVTVSYSGDKFRITSDELGADSSIVVIEGTTDFLRTVKMNGDVPVDGREASGIVSADHAIEFVARANTAGGDTIVVTFPAGFGLGGINHEDVDLIIAGGQADLGDNASGATWGVAASGQVVTITSGTGTIGSSQSVIIKIGRHATHQFTGTEQISNPTTTGLYQITIEIKTGAAIKQSTKIAVYIVSDDSVIVKATVDPVLSFSIWGGNVLDFGTLEPNAYHKLGGARSAYGSIDLTGVTINADRDTQTVTVRGKVYELSDDGVPASAGNIPVMIVDNENNYLTVAAVTANLYRAINNNDGDLVRANVSATNNTVVYVLATGIGTAGNGYSLATTVTGANVSGADFTDGHLGYNNKSTSVRYNTGSDVGNDQTGTNLVVSTNSAGGYVISIKNTDTASEADGLTNGTSDIDAWTSAASYGYGVFASAQSARYGDGTSSIISAVFRDEGSTDQPGAMSTDPAALATYGGPTAGDNIGVEYNVRISADQPAGAYSDTITYICTSTY